jgi:hypothetical protein
MLIYLDAMQNLIHIMIYYTMITAANAILIAGRLLGVKQVKGDEPRRA